MRRAVQFAIFFSFFFSMALLINLYVFLHMSTMFALEQNIWFWLLLLLSSASFFFTVYLESSNILSKIAVVTVSLWMGIVVIALFMLFGYDILRLFVPLNPLKAGWTVVLMTATLTIGGIANALFVRTRTEEMSSKKLKRDLKIVHLSDFHLGPIHGAGYFARVMKRVNAMKPDLILITGDLLDSTERHTSLSFEVLNEVDAPVFMSAGNHEFYVGLEAVTKVIDQYKITMIRNGTIDRDDVQIIGIDNYGLKKDFEKILRGVRVDRHRFTVLMHHQPIGVEEVGKKGVDLMLAGHTHGGQLFMFTLMARLIWKYPGGFYKLNGLRLNTSTGTGTWGPPIRLGTNNEITLIKVKGTGAESRKAPAK
jgi:predicted MPP superfamily phosphohydrolase